MMEAPEQTDRVRTGRKVTGKITMYKLDFKHPVHVYFVGIGGISMSGLAEILSSEGFRVSGSDRQESAMTRCAGTSCASVSNRSNSWKS